MGLHPEINSIGFALLEVSTVNRQPSKKSIKPNTNSMQINILVSFTLNCSEKLNIKGK